MTKKIFIIFFYTSAIITAHAQNLVINPGFEKAQHLPEGSDNSINRAVGWSAPKFNSDYYYKGTGRHSGTPKNVFGRQTPHSGAAYGGICTRKKFLEYLQTKLKDTLVKDQEYLIELYISRAERSIKSLKEFGVYFTNKKIINIPDRGLTVQPQVDFINKKGFRNKKKWIKLSAIYKAEGNETVIILGHFNYEASDDKRWILCHYYIDDVSVTAVKTDSSENTNDNEPIVIEKEEIKEVEQPDFLPTPGEAITLKNVFFNTNKSELLPNSFPELNKLVAYLKENHKASIIISGHTDNTGNEPQNKLLSEARAKAVRDYLVAKYIEISRIQYIGYGSQKPISTNDTNTGKQENRRVEFIIPLAD